MLLCIQVEKTNNQNKNKQPKKETAMSKKINQLKVNLVAIHKLWLVISMAVAAVYLTLNSQHLVLYVIAGTLAFHSLSFVLAAIIRQESVNSRKKS